MAFGAANLARQIVLIVTTAEIPQTFRVASWAATALVVIIVINSVAVALQRRSDDAELEQSRSVVPLWPLRRGDERGEEPDESPTKPDQTDNSTQPTAHSVPGPSKEEIVMNRQLQEEATTSIKWAPWWAYVAIIVAANYLRRAVAADGGAPAARVAVALALSAALFVIITVVYRATARHDGTHRTRPYRTHAIDDSDCSSRAHTGR